MAQSPATNPVIAPLTVALVVASQHTSVPKREMGALLQQFFIGILKGTVEVKTVAREKGNSHRQGVVELKRDEPTSRSVYLRAQPGDNGTCWEVAIGIARDLDFATVIRAMKRRSDEWGQSSPATPAAPAKSEAELLVERTQLERELARVKGEREAAAGKVDEYKAEQTTLRSRRTALVSEITAIDASLSGLDGQITSAGQDIGRLAERVEFAELELQEVTTALAGFEERRESLNRVAAVASENGLDLRDPATLQQLAAIFAGKGGKQ